MGIQTTDWGQVEWLYEDEGEKNVPRPKMSVGIVTLDEGGYQLPHVHYEEQMIYMLEGKGTAYVNMEPVELKPGSIFLWPAGIIHEVYNEGDCGLKHIMVSNPDFVDTESIMHLEQEGDGEHPEAIRLLHVAVEAVRTQFLETTPYPYVIVDRSGNVVSKSKVFPEFCLKRCKKDLQYDTSECMNAGSIHINKKEQEFCCSHGLKVFTTPIYFHEQFLGYIQGGYIRQSSSRLEQIEGLYDTPESAVAGIKGLLRKIAKAIRNFCEFDHFRRTLSEKDLQIASGIKSQDLLMKNLRDTEYAMTELRINNHFLFNTLNSMAAMALEGGVVSLYQSIINLSKMFHYTLREKDNTALLKKEMEYLNAYLELQRLRYGDNLEIRWDIEDSAKGLTVPFNILQPVVENAFTHGFYTSEKMVLGICVKVLDDRITICISNNGKPVDEQRCNAINLAMKSRTAHGLSMVYHKLYVIFGNNFNMEIRSNDKEGTNFLMDIPVSSQQGFVR